MYREERSKGEGCREGGREGEETDRERERRREGGGGREREGRELGKGGPGMSVLKNNLCMGVCMCTCISSNTEAHVCVY